jgi:hypothetical protein
MRSQGWGDAIAEILNRAAHATARGAFTSFNSCACCSSSWQGGCLWRDAMCDALAHEGNRTACELRLRSLPLLALQDYNSPSGQQQGGCTADTVGPRVSPRLRRWAQAGVPHVADQRLR